MARWSMLVISAGRTWSVELPANRTLVIGRGRQASIEIKDPAIADRHALLVVREASLHVEAVRGAGDVLVNDVAVSSSVEVHHGDELRVGPARLVAQYTPVVPAVRLRVASYDELMAQLAAELTRAGRSRPVGVVAIAFPSLNVTARQALTRRVIDEVAKGGVCGAWGQFATDLLVGVLPEVTDPELSDVFKVIPAIAGPRASVATARSPVDGLDADALIGALWARLVGPGVAEEGEPIIADPVMVRLYGLIDSLVDSEANVCVTGAPGSGRSTFLRTLATRAGKQLIERRGRFSGESLREGSWVLVQDLEAGEQVVAPRGGRVLATAASGPDPVRELSFEVSFALPPLYARPSEVPLMAEAFLAQARVVLGRPRLHLAPDALPLLSTFSWPGNVLELRNVMFRAAKAAVRDEVGRDSLPVALSSIPPVENLRGAMESAERELLLEALSRTRWNVTAAAGRLGMARRTVVYRMQRLGLKRPAR